jgi:hypothetical protein
VVIRLFYLKNKGGGLEASVKTDEVIQASILDEFKKLFSRAQTASGQKGGYNG